MNNAQNSLFINSYIIIGYSISKNNIENIKNNLYSLCVCYIHYMYLTKINNI